MLLLLTSAFGPQSAALRGQSGPPVASWRFSPIRYEQWNTFPGVQPQIAEPYAGYSQLPVDNLIIRKRFRRAPHALGAWINYDTPTESRAGI